MRTGQTDFQDVSMKKFLMCTPQQPEYNLKYCTYEPMGDAKKLEYGGDTRFPLIPLVHGYTEPGELADIYTVSCDSDYCRRSLELLDEELATFCTDYGINYRLNSIEVDLDDSIESLLTIFQGLIDVVEDDDLLHACITYGSKPMPIVLVMALQYAYRINTNVSIECVVYGKLYGGKIDRAMPEPWPAQIYDVTSLVKMDEIVRVLAEQKIENPREVLSKILAM